MNNKQPSLGLCQGYKLSQTQTISFVLVVSYKALGLHRQNADGNDQSCHNDNGKIHECFHEVLEPR